MTIETNKLAMHRFTEFINTASEVLAAELISPSAIFHVPGRSEPLLGPAGYLATIGMMRGGFPDIRWTLEEMIADGDKVVVRLTITGTQLGPWGPLPPTGKPVRFEEIVILRFVDGKVVQQRGLPDNLAALRQLGVVPTPQATSI